ncbi:MAG: class III cytochrome C family protein [Desulfobacter sp.]|nr:MAG: class III cytochrome C family protein [Desulfobacter sp.]
MKRFFIAVFCFAILLLTHDAIAQDPQTLVLPTGNMILAAPEGGDRAPKLSPVSFPHSLHFSYSCKDCHHSWDGVEPVQSCATAGCHENLWASKPGELPLDARRVKSLTGAYHQVCRTCHRMEAAEQKEAGIKHVATGPIACDGCHSEIISEMEDSGEELSIPLGSMTIEPPEEVDAKRGPVEFPHGLHFEFACQSCHHDWDGESDVENCTASGCHDETSPSGTRSIKAPDNVLYYLAAYHNACLDCHRDMEKVRQDQIKKEEKQGSVNAAALPKAGPVGCKGCHS